MFPEFSKKLEPMRHGPPETPQIFPCFFGAVEVSCSTTWPEGNRIPRSWLRERSSGWSVSDGISRWPSCTSDDTLLVGGLDHILYFPMYWEESFQLTFIFFRGVGLPPTRIDSTDFQRRFWATWTSWSTWMAIWRKESGRCFSMDAHAERANIWT